MDDEDDMVDKILTQKADGGSGAEDHSAGAFHDHDHDGHYGGSLQCAGDVVRRDHDQPQLFPKKCAVK